MENTNQKKLIYQYGLLTGAVAVAFEIMRFSMGIHYENDGITTLVSILILFGGILAGSLAVKKNNAGLISLNQTLKSYIFAIIGAEYILKWLPVGTHDWNKFVKPEILIGICKKNSLSLKKIDGITFNPIFNQWNVSLDKSVNYISIFRKI